MTKRYVLVVEDTDTAGDRGVDAVYVPPDGADVVAVQDEIRAAYKGIEGVTVTVVEALPWRGWTQPRVCPDCGQSTWRQRFGCTLPGCENYGVLVGKAPTVEAVDPPVTELWDTINNREAKS